MATTLRTLLADQIDFYWQVHLWPRLQGLTDDEYLWEPVEGSWSLRAGDDGVVHTEATAPEPAVLQPLGPRGGPFADDSMAALVAHLNREAMAHGAEMCLLRDLYRAQAARRDAVVAAALGGRTGDLDRALRLDGGVRDLPDRVPGLLTELAGIHRWDELRLLVEHGFPAGAATEDGTTALHYAAAAGALDEVRFLVEHGADPGAVESRFGAAPGGWAGRFGRADVAAHLSGHAG